MWAGGRVCCYSVAVPLNSSVAGAFGRRRRLCLGLSNSKDGVAASLIHKIPLVRKGM